MTATNINSKLTGLMMTPTATTSSTRRRTKTTIRNRHRILSLSVALLLLHESLLCASATHNSHINNSLKFSQPLVPAAMLNDSDGFKPFMPTSIDTEYISGNIFTETGQYRVFPPMDSDLRMASVISSSNGDTPREETIRSTTQQRLPLDSTSTYADPTQNEINKKYSPDSTQKAENSLKSELNDLEMLLVQYIEFFLTEGIVAPTSGLRRNRTERSRTAHLDGEFDRHIRRLLNDENLLIDHSIPRAVQSGRLLFFAGLKKILWPIFIGIQVIKSVLFALLLPSLIGPLGKILAKGSTSVSGFNRPSETIDNLEFKDNMFNFDDDNNNKYIMNGGYPYNQPEASSNKFSTLLYDTELMNNQPLSRFGTNNNQQDSYVNALQGINSYKRKTTAAGTSGGSSMTFEAFQKIPASSLFLANYDPFYSPLLSRLDSVFVQLKMNSANEDCREKLICLMYADPAKYAPYSNLVSAQLSRELNELRRPTSDNPEILRFFKYMRAAKDGQDGIDCEKIYESCTEFKDLENPAMVSTYHDINKLVEARKLA